MTFDPFLTFIAVAIFLCGSACAWLVVWPIAFARGRRSAPSLDSIELNNERREKLRVMREADAAKSALRACNRYNANLARRLKEMDHARGTASALLEAQSNLPGLTRHL